MEHTEQHTDPVCPICQASGVRDFFVAENVPAQDGVVYPTKEEALNAPAGTVTLTFCPNCHYIYNRTYDPAKITFLDYDFNLHYSPTYQKFNKELIASLIEHHGLRNKSILGVACGRGHFLVQLCQTGNNRGLGIDPSYGKADDLQFDPDQISFKKDYYSEKYEDLRVDFITCRHLMDELSDPVGFLKLFKHNLKEKTGGVYLEVPNTFKTFKDQLIWNIGYAKRTWYTPASIAYQLELAGFTVTKIGKYLDGDYLGVEAVPAELGQGAEESQQETTEEVLEAFSAAFLNGQKTWNETFDGWKHKKFRVALWGAGMRGINFLSAFPRHDIISLVLDINPHRQGKFLPTSAFEVKAPEALSGQDIDVLIISNATYKQEIMEHARSLGFTGTFEVF
ncbi:MAG: methyltransferase domain-containing protein [Saprospiraceae bacterium]|nr:methyltransferase domain-containing protein [Lewinella sp.]